jgi:hypothetical protein
MAKLVQPPMKVLLRDAATGHFYAAPDRWETSRSLAFDFVTVEDATHCGRRLQRARMEVVLAYDDPLCDLVLPIAVES